MTVQSRAPGVFDLASTWLLPGTPQDVWAVVAQLGDWSRWWPSVRCSRLVLPGTADGTGRVAEYRVGTPLGYALRFTLCAVELQQPRLAHLDVAGDLMGTAWWRATSVADGTEVSISWRVWSRRRWVRSLRGLAPWAHGRVMREGQAGLTRVLTGR